MSAPMTKHWPLALRGADKSNVRTQFAALCYRVKNDKVRVLLVTSRGSGRWIIPKGWPMANQSPAECAATEAWEEAGVRGRADARPLGIFSYIKDMDKETKLPCVAMVYALRVSKIVPDYPEKNERSRKWVSRKKAAAMVDCPELSRILANFDPRLAR